MRARLLAGVAVMLVIGAVRAESPLMIPDSKSVSAVDEKAIRAMLRDYVKAVADNDREKALGLCIAEDEDVRKVARLSCEVDFAIAKLHAAVEKAFGKNAWGTLGESIGEMTAGTMETATITATENPDEANVTWTDKSKLPAEERLTGTVTVKRMKAGWRFQLVTAREQIVPARRYLRDELAELAELTAALGGTVKTEGAVKEAVAHLVNEINKTDSAESGGGRTIREVVPAAPDLEN